MRNKWLEILHALSMLCTIGLVNLVCFWAIAGELRTDLAPYVAGSVILTAATKDESKQKGGSYYGRH